MVQLDEHFVIFNGRIKSTFLGPHQGALLLRLQVVASHDTVELAEELPMDFPIGKLIQPLLDTVGVTQWEHLRGKFVQVRMERCYGVVQAIGHIIEERWFDAEELVAPYRQSQQGDAGVLDNIRSTGKSSFVCCAC